jgi:putative cardiolipin synthase
LLATGLDAFVARVGLIELADRTLDLQYYIFHGDTTGEIIVDRLIAAADRGVRVRLLLDDWGTLEKKDEAVVGLDAHANIEIRLFNPYLHRSGMGRVGELVRSFSRVNRRMHNKQLVADGVAVVLGGRNIGDEYFGLGELDFQDVDVLAGGPIVRESAAIFEAYWQSVFAKPVSALGTPAPSPERFDGARRALAERVEQRRTSQYAKALSESPLATDLRAARDILPHWADARMFADPPDKVSEPAGIRGPHYLGAHVAAAVRAAQLELLLVSPYFVPGKQGVATLAGKRREGAGVSVLTNSLAATDVWLVHAGYRKYRRPLLRQGVRLYELKAEGRAAPGRHAPVGSSRASLHGKTFVFDRQSVFIGSMNLDARSIDQNTEDGVLIESPALAREVAALFERWSGPAFSYDVRLTGGRHLEWLATGGGQAVRFTREPEAGFWRRLGAVVCSVLPIDRLI